MYKTRIILLIIIGAGILFAGAGAGMAFHEFASFTYAGEKEAGPHGSKRRWIWFRLPCDGGSSS